MVTAGNAKKEADKRQRIRVVITLLSLAVFVTAFLLLANYLYSGLAKDDGPRQFSQSQIIADRGKTVDPFYVLLIGSDSRKGTALYTGKASEQSQQDQYSDIMTLVRVDPKTYTLTFLSVPRDTVMPGTSKKINSTLLGNQPEEVVKATEKLTGVPINYYMMTTFISFETLINDLGGVVVDIPKKVTVADPSTGRDITVEAGQERRLNGAEALVFARARKEYGTDQDALRQVNVRQIERSMIESALTSEEDAEYSIAALKDNVQTNIDFDLLLSVGLDFVLHRDQVQIFSGTGPYRGGNDSTGQWVVPEDEEAWQLLMEVVDAGQDPNEVIVEPTFK